MNREAKQDESVETKALKDKIFQFGFCGTHDVFNNKLEELSNLAEKEDWTTPNKVKNDRLYNFITKTFERCEEQNKISISDDESFALFNTGLMTNNGDDIYGYFTQNRFSNAQKWFFNGFIICNDRRLSKSKYTKPQLATYADDTRDFYFNSDFEIELASDHIFDDHWDDSDRYPEAVKQLGKSIAIALIKSAFETAKKKVKRNNRLVVPQFYMGKIMYLMPIEIPVLNNEKLVMALAIEKLPNDIYRANTIFSVEWAYSKARLIMKPESSWLIDIK